MQQSGEEELRRAVAIAIVASKRKREAEMSQLQAKHAKLEEENAFLRAAASQLGAAVRQLGSDNSGDVENCIGSSEPGGEAAPLALLSRLDRCGYEICDEQGDAACVSGWEGRIICWAAGCACMLGSSDCSGVSRPFSGC